MEIYKIKNNHKQIDDALQEIDNALDILNIKNCDFNTAYYTIDQRGAISDPDTMVDGIYVKDKITGELIKLTEGQRKNPKYNFIEWLKQNTHRYCSILNTETNKLILKQLSDNNSKQYIDETDATSDVTSTTEERDVWVKLPCDVYYKTEQWTIPGELNNDYVLVTLTKNTPNIDEIDNWCKHDEYTLIGAYKATQRNDKFYTISNVQPTNGVKPEQQKVKVGNRGTNFTLIDYNTNRFLMYLYYGYYLNLDCKNITGWGTNNHTGNLMFYGKRTGLTDELGMTDTDITSGTGNVNAPKQEMIQGFGDNIKSINFFGLENIYGDLCEPIGDLLLQNKTSVQNYLNTQDEINIVLDSDTINTYTNANKDDIPNNWYACIVDNSNLIRAIKLCPGGTISKLIFGKYSDIMPKATATNETLYYVALYYNSTTTNSHLYRGGWCGNTGFNNSMAVVASYVSDYAGNFVTSIGCRVIYKGSKNDITIVN